jgi:hypothetical protein
MHIGKVRSDMISNQSKSMDRELAHSPGGKASTSKLLYFAVFKAGAHTPMIADLDDTTTYIPMQAGYHPIRWRIFVDAMLIKKSGAIHVDTL